jgi:hypothetical protein
MKFRPWLGAAAFVLGASAVPAFACESGHWVNKVAEHGRIIVLEDSRVWLVSDHDAMLTSMWLPMTDITACKDRLINNDDGEAADARPIR